MKAFMNESIILSPKVEKLAFCNYPAQYKQR